MSRELLSEVVINNFSEYIQLSSKRRPIPYIKGKSLIPKKYSDPSKYGFVNDKLVELETNKIIIKNVRSVGKPRLKKINGQSIYNGGAHTHSRANLILHLHEYFKPYLNNIELPTDLKYYPLTLELIFYIKDEGPRTIDNDNRWIWRKAIQDTLTELGKWPDDHNYVINRNEEETILIDNINDQKLIIRIYGN